MKYGMKIFLTTFVLVIISIYVIGSLMIANNYRLAIENQINKNLFQINNIYNNFNLYNNTDWLSAVANQYLKDKVYMKIYSNDELLFSNISEISTNIEKELLDNNENKLKTYISNKKLYTGLVNNNIMIITINDISDIYISIEEERKFFYVLSVIFSIGIALVLYIIITILTRKITRLNEAATEIENGNYSVKVESLGNDEVGKLAETFNTMASSIDYNINKIQKIADDRETFINNLTHEIRTPLTSIIGFSSLLINTSTTDKEKIIQYSNKIHEEGLYIKNITDKLIELILLDRENKLKKQNLSQSINVIIEELKDTFVQVEFKADIMQNIIATFDNTLLKTLIFNLVKNGIASYNEKDTKKIRILLQAEYIRIEDFGSGISKENIEKINQPFYTINKDRNREISGMGLGLPLCNRIVEFFKWTLTIDSTINIGTTITIKINKR